MLKYKDLKTFYKEQLGFISNIFFYKTYRLYGNAIMEINC
jgi:hypothetical protein